MSGLTERDFEVLVRLTDCLRDRYWDDFEDHEDDDLPPSLCTAREARALLSTLHNEDRDDGIFGDYSRGQLISIVASYIAVEFEYGRTELGDATFKRDGDNLIFSQPMRIVLTRRGKEFAANRKAMFAQIQSLRDDHTS